MPRKSQKQQVEEAAAAKAAEKAERVRKAQGDTFKFVKEPEAKLPPQAQGIVNLVKAAGKKGITRKDLVEAMEGVIETRQPLGRILTYYQKRLTEIGAVEMTKAE